MEVLPGPSSFTRLQLFLLCGHCLRRLWLLTAVQLQFHSSCLHHSSINWKDKESWRVLFVGGPSGGITAQQWSRMKQIERFAEWSEQHSPPNNTNKWKEIQWNSWISFIIKVSEANQRQSTFIKFLIWLKELSWLVEWLKGGWPPKREANAPATTNSLHQFQSTNQIKLNFFSLIGGWWIDGEWWVAERPSIAAQLLFVHSLHSSNFQFFFIPFIHSPAVNPINFIELDYGGGPHARQQSKNQQQFPFSKRIAEWFVLLLNGRGLSTFTYQ